MQETGIMEKTKSVRGRLIRLTYKQWFHIIESHDYMAGNIEKVLETVYRPGFIVKGTKGELIALKHYLRTNITDKCCVVIYKENNDGFIITAFFTSKPETIKKKGEVIWPE